MIHYACDHQKEGMCPACEIDFLDNCIARDMKRIEELKEQLKQQKERNRTCQQYMI